MNRGYAEQLVRKWVTILRLDAWDLHIVWPEDYDKWPEKEDDFGDFTAHGHAQVWRARDYDIARVYINEAMLTSEAPDSVRRLEVAIVHELLHLLTREMEFVLDQLDGLLHRDVQDLIESTYRHQVEGTVDKLAYILVTLSYSVDPLV